METGIPQVVKPSEQTAASAQELKDKYVAAKGAVSDLAGGATATAKNYAGDIKDNATDWVQSRKQAATQKASDMQDTVQDYLQRNPIQSLGIAAAAGFLLGLILKRK